MGSTNATECEGCGRKTKGRLIIGRSLYPCCESETCREHVRRIDAGELEPELVVVRRSGFGKGVMHLNVSR